MRKWYLLKQDEKEKGLVFGLQPDLNQKYTPEAN